MPSSIDKIRVPKDKDRRRKLTPADKLKIKSLFFDAGWGIREIAREYEKKCSRRLIQFMLFPEREKHNANLFKERQKDGRYYNREKHTKAVKGLREYKKKLNLLSN